MRAVVIVAISLVIVINGCGGCGGIATSPNASSIFVFDGNGSRVALSSFGVDFDTASLDVKNIYAVGTGNAGTMVSIARRKAEFQARRGLTRGLQLEFIVGSDVVQWRQKDTTTYCLMRYIVPSAAR